MSDKQRIIEEKDIQKSFQSVYEKHFIQNDINVDIAKNLAKIFAEFRVISSGQKFPIILKEVK